MSKIIHLIQPDSPFLSEPLSFPNLGLLYISSYLKKHGYNPNFYDLTGGVNLPNGLIGDIFGFSCQITQFKECIRIMNELRLFNPRALFVIGGPFPTHSPNECLDAGFDIVIQGEGEIPMLDVVNDFPMVIKGIKYSGRFIDPNEIIPDWDAINPLRYKYQLAGRRCINIMTKRGNCPFNCSFCAKQEFKKSPLRFRTVDNVLKEVKMLKEKYGYGSVAIYDDDVLIDKKRDMKIFKGLKEMDIKFRCMTRANLATKSDLKLLKKYGCEEICIGVESADPKILKTINKGIKIEEDTEFIRYAKKIGLRVKVYLIIGLPGETKKSVEKTKKWLIKNKTENYDISIFTPYPGSDIYNNKKKYDINWDEDKLKELWFSGEAQYNNCAVRTNFLSSEDILKLRQKIFTECKRGDGGTTNYWGPIQNEI